MAGDQMTGDNNFEKKAAESLDDSRGDNVRLPPPLIFLVLLLAGAGLEFLLPTTLGIPRPLAVAGLALVLFGIAVAILVNAEFKRRNTRIEPWKPTTAIVTTGFYRFSRNPIYLGFCLVDVGIGMYSDSIWIVAAAIPTVVLLYFFVIVKEEAYLEQKFGDEYLRYKSQVRRWL
ncbi:MAG: isoprenylcysteine carboxylmethyltransferase family protein [Gammaproteobacteria bacterium]